MARRRLSSDSAPPSRVRQGIETSDRPGTGEAIGQPTARDHRGKGSRPTLSRVGRSVSLEHEIAHLRDLETKGLRARWRSVTGRDAPPHLSRQLLFSMLAYRIQAEALGDLDAETIRLLKKLGASGSDNDVGSLTDAFDQRRRNLLPGTILTREFNGETHRVMVVKDGFAWNGRTYGSLSTIANAITGTKWNGPRFFALRDRKPTELQS